MCTKIFCWNVRGFNNSRHRTGFKKWCRSCKPIFGGVIETHVKQPKSTKFISELLPGWSFEENYAFSELGKIWVLWDPSVYVVIIAKSLQMFCCQGLLPGLLSLLSMRLMMRILGRFCGMRLLTLAEILVLLIGLGLC